ncbi:MAG: hypothetical protein HY452_01355 [Parcubacteria group bacterium]|nr:hypothetical protein [Parcubacteria group bacterium]
MRFFNIILIIGCWLSGGCSYYAISLPVAAVDSQIRPVKDNRLERIRAGNVLFVNRSAVWMDVAVFDGYYSQDQLIVFGPDGLPALAVAPMGQRFEVGPADRDLAPRWGEKLIGGFYPGQSITLLVISKDMIGSMVGRPQVIHDRINDRPMGEDYYRYDWLGPNGGRMAREIVNDVVYLPNVCLNSYGSNTLNLNIDLNMLLRRGLHRTE